MCPGGTPRPCVERYGVTRLRSSLRARSDMRVLLVEDAPAVVAAVFRPPGGPTANGAAA